MCSHWLWHMRKLEHMFNQSWCRGSIQLLSALACCMSLLAQILGLSSTPNILPVSLDYADTDTGCYVYTFH